MQAEPGDAEGHYWLGVAYEGKGDLEKAAFQYRETLRFNPKHPEAGKALTRLGSFSQRR